MKVYSNVLRRVILKYKTNIIAMAIIFVAIIYIVTALDIYRKKSIINERSFFDKHPHDSQRV